MNDNKNVIAIVMQNQGTKDLLINMLNQMHGAQF